MSSSLDRLLPPLDLHAHVSADVTATEIAALAPAVVFAVTRTLDEAVRVEARRDERIVWGCGVHPGRADALDTYDSGRFRKLRPSFTLVGEVGLDRRASRLPKQREVLRDVLDVAAESKVLISLHSSGASSLIVEHLEETATPGAILHWFTGSAAEVERASSAGAFFSVNSAMRDEQLRVIPSERVLPETDFPFTKRGRTRRPGDTERLEERLATLWGESQERVRRRWYENLRTLGNQANVLDRLPDALLVPLLAA